jgi:hypothetical protein
VAVVFSPDGRSIAEYEKRHQVPLIERDYGRGQTPILVTGPGGALWRFAQGPSARQSATAGQEEKETQRNRAQLIASCVIFAIISIPLILQVVPPNGLYGFRVGSMRSNPAIWYPANAFMGWALLVAAAMSSTVLLLLPAGIKRWLLWVAFLLPVAGALVASFAYLERVQL